MSGSNITKTFIFPQLIEDGFTSKLITQIFVVLLIASVMSRYGISWLQDKAHNGGKVYSLCDDAPFMTKLNSS